MTKVIHVQLIFKKKNYYFGSISAIYDYLDESEIGIAKSTLLHCTDQVKVTQTAIIRKVELLRRKRGFNRSKSK